MSIKPVTPEYQPVVPRKGPTRTPQHEGEDFASDAQHSITSNGYRDIQLTSK